MQKVFRTKAPLCSINDIRKTVHAICTLNDVEAGSIREGDILLIPSMI